MPADSINRSSNRTPSAPWRDSRTIEASRKEAADVRRTAAAAIALVNEVRSGEPVLVAHASAWAVLQSVAPKLGCTAETLRKWVRQAQRDAEHRPGLTTSERERLKELEREVATCGAF